MPTHAALRGLRFSLLAAAGVGVAACGSSPAPAGQGGSSGGHGGAASGGHGGTSVATATGGAGGHGGAMGGSGGHGGAADPVCAGATPIAATDGAPSGFAACPDGTIHRVAPAACDATIDAPACTGTEMTITCTSDADCTAAPHGRCVSTAVVEDMGVLTSCGCAYSCVDDAECGAGNVCVCGGVLPIDATWSFCAPATCADGAGCASGECALSIYFNGCVGDVEVACRAPGDACRTDADCAGDGGAHRACVMSEGAWQCLGWTCVLGRPLVVDGAARTAAPAARADWIEPAGPRLDGLDASARAELSRRWSEIGALEHASVASFARFTLELLALGAPSSLVAEAQRAALDEVEHARLAYGLASAYAGAPVGPGPLELGSLRVAADRREVLSLLVREACVGEALAVVEAMALAEVERDPAVARVHRRVAADEQRHAELGYRALSWLLEGAGAELREVARRAFAEAIAAAERGPALHRRALREVIAPCADALLAA